MVFAMGFAKCESLGGPVFMFSSNSKNALIWKMINLENMFLDTPFSGRLNGISPTYGYNIYIYIYCLNSLWL